MSFFMLWTMGKMNGRLQRLQLKIKKEKEPAKLKVLKKEAIRLSKIIKGNNENFEKVWGVTLKGGSHE